MTFKIFLTTIFCSALVLTGTAFAAEKSNEQIAKELANPLANIINMPLQLNWDYGGGPNDDGQHYYLQVQPVIPVMLNEDWMMLSRTILLFENKHNFGYEAKTGMGDTTQTFFLAKAPKQKGGFLWGVGPALLIPTATEHELGAEKWGAGPSVIFVYEAEKWTFGLLANHIWSYAGDSDRNYVNKSFLQPFIARHLPDAWTITLTSEYTYDWHEDEEIFPLNLMAAKVVRFGKMPISFSLGGRYYADKPSGGPDWGLRAMVTLVLPGIN